MPIETEETEEVVLRKTERVKRTGTNSVYQQATSSKHHEVEIIEEVEALETEQTEEPVLISQNAEDNTSSADEVKKKQAPSIVLLHFKKRRTVPQLHN